MKIALVSTYPPAPCGIGDYTRNLRQGLEVAAPEVAIPVIAEQHPSVQSELDAGVHRSWRRQSAWDVSATEATLALRPDVVHLQHEEAIFRQDGHLIRFLSNLGRAGIRRVVTLHSVYGGRLGLPFWWPPPLFHRAIARNADAIIVHQGAGGRDFLERHGVPGDKIHVIPHGTPRVEGMSRDDARTRLGLPRSKDIALFLGVIHPRKNLHTIIAAVERVAKELPSVCLLIAGRVRERSVLDRLYSARIDRSVRKGTALGFIAYRKGFVASQDLPALLAAADVVLLPHDQSYGSASGILHLALGAGRAAICSSSPKFGEAREAFGRQIPQAFVDAKDVRGWAGALRDLLSSPATRELAESLARAEADRTSWNAVGRQHFDLYRAVIARA